MTQSDFDAEQGEPKELSPREKIAAVVEEAFNAVRDIAANFDDPGVKATAMSFEQDFRRVADISEKYEFVLNDGQRIGLAAWAAEGIAKIKKICEMNPENKGIRAAALSFERLFREIGALAN